MYHVKVMGDPCPICLESDPDLPIECGHRFHSDCIEQWRQRSKACPMCRFAEPTKYRVTISIEPLGYSNTQVTSNIRVYQEMFGVLFRDNTEATVTLDVAEMDTLREIMTAIGVQFS